LNQYDDLIQAATEKWLPGYDWRLLKAQYIQESQLKPFAVSPAGALGLAQFLASTWAEWSPRAGYEGRDRTDPEASIFTGACYMAHLKRQWASPRPEIDRICLAMASYNAGLGNLLKAQKAANGALAYKDIVSALPSVTGAKSAETLNYPRKILAEWVRQVAG
jgi:membrane-bound lytic murein transglycosylase MltF